MVSIVYDDLAAHQAHHLIGNCHAKAGASIFLNNIRALLLKRTEYLADEFWFHSEISSVHPLFC